MMRTLSKSKLLAFRQCPKRLWLEVHQPQLRDGDTRYRTTKQDHGLDSSLDNTKLLFGDDAQVPVRESQWTRPR